MEYYLFYARYSLKISEKERKQNHRETISFVYKNALKNLSEKQHSLTQTAQLAISTIFALIFSVLILI